MAGEEHLSVSLARAGSLVVVTAAGEVDAASVAALDSALDEAIREHDHHVVLDACGVTFIDSTGITLLVGGMRRLNRTRRRLALACATSGPVGRALEITGLDHTFECHATAEGAVGALADAPLLGR